MDEYSGWMDFMAYDVASSWPSRQRHKCLQGDARRDYSGRQPTSKQKVSTGFKIQASALSRQPAPTCITSRLVKRPFCKRQSLYLRPWPWPAVSSHLCHVLIWLSSVMHSAAVTHQQPSTSLQQRHDIYFVLVLEQ